MEKPHYTIAASTSDEFLKIEERLKDLHPTVLAQIESVKNGGVGIECTFKKVWGESVKIALPSDVRQMTDFGEYTGCYSDYFFFKIPPYDTTKVKITIFTVENPGSKRNNYIKELSEELKDLQDGNLTTIDEKYFTERLKDIIGKIKNL